MILRYHTVDPTCYGVLTHRNTRPLPERPVRPVSRDATTPGTKTAKRKREREGTAKPSAAQNIDVRLLEKLEPQLERAYGELLRYDPSVAR